MCVNSFTNRSRKFMVTIRGEALGQLDVKAEAAKNKEKK